MLKDREILYSPAHGDFYEYDSLTGLWYTVTEDKLATELHSLLVDIDRKTVNNGSLVQWSNLAFRNATVRTQRGCREDRQALMEQRIRHAQVAKWRHRIRGRQTGLNAFQPEVFLIGRNLTQRIIIFEGVGNTGRSTLAQIIEAIVGGQGLYRTTHRVFEGTV
jgi:hypothetical protein